MRKIAVLVSMLALAGCASEPTETPRAIALSWCERHHPDDPACRRTALEAHRHCITSPGDYDACRAGQYAERQTATN